MRRVHRRGMRSRVRVALRPRAPAAAGAVVRLFVRSDVIPVWYKLIAIANLASIRRLICCSVPTNQLSDEIIDCHFDRFLNFSRQGAARRAVAVHGDTARTSTARHAVKALIIHRNLICFSSPKCGRHVV
ncbi:hypothetical protein EVAR_7885_1 [Eumeta japonica]|uniref:Uncharacterized protein n=1 Tax=Eumeta variegata TaxID=151549 RepID=A0A4C1TV37_EUMVA|nr:hypothetical protein EVAR_7885_1 [Eumeta japonica]